MGPVRHWTYQEDWRSALLHEIPHRDAPPQELSLCCSCLHEIVAADVAGDERLGSESEVRNNARMDGRDDIARWDVGRSVAELKTRDVEVTKEAL